MSVSVPAWLRVVVARGTGWVGQPVRLFGFTIDRTDVSDWTFLDFDFPDWTLADLARGASRLGRFAWNRSFGSRNHELGKQLHRNPSQPPSGYTGRRVTTSEPSSVVRKRLLCGAGWVTLGEEVV